MFLSLIGKLSRKNCLDVRYICTQFKPLGEKSEWHYESHKSVGGLTRDSVARVDFFKGIFFRENNSREHIVTLKICHRGRAQGKKTGSNSEATLSGVYEV